MASETEQSRYVIFADESGDHGLNALSHSRAFVSAFVIFDREVYEKIAVPTFKDFKRRFFGDVLTPLHEREIRKGEGAFRTLSGAAHRERAFEDLRVILHHLPYWIVAVGIDKDQFTPNPDSKGSPYHRRFIETLVACLMTIPDINASQPPTEIVADSRGAKEDQELQRLVDSLTDSDEPEARSFQFRIRFTRKRDVEIGVEIADLVANPISRRVLRQAHPIFDFELLKPKFLPHPNDPSRISLVVLDHE